MAIEGGLGVYENAISQTGSLKRDGMTKKQYFLCVTLKKTPVLEKERKLLCSFVKKPQISYCIVFVKKKEYKLIGILDLYEVSELIITKLKSITGIKLVTILQDAFLDWRSMTQLHFLISQYDEEFSSLDKVTYGRIKLYARDDESFFQEHLYLGKCISHILSFIYPEIHSAEA
ncbi:hypothetical protein K501DRAFT_266261 [Backusella circina FSU 941]|nr:hypothetical protein K501DRAFT_266261 [Backusella circina FSU 941]